MHSYTHTLIQCTHTLIHSCNALIHSYTHALMLIHSYTHTLIYSQHIHSNTHTLIHSNTYALIPYIPSMNPISAYKGKHNRQ